MASQEIMLFTFIAFILVLALLSVDMARTTATATTGDLWLYNADVNYSVNASYSGQYNQTIVSGYTAPPVCKVGLLESIGCIFVSMGWLFGLMGTSSPYSPLSYMIFVPMGAVIVLVIVKILKDVIPFA